MRRRELWVTLDTNDKSLAKSRACAISLATDRLFSGVHRVTQELFQDINDSLRESVDDQLRPLLDSLISAYESELSALRSQYRVMNAEHLLHRMRDHKHFMTFVGTAKESVEELQAIVKHSPAFDVQEKMSAILGHFSNIETWTKPKEPDKSPLFSEASEAFILASSQKWKDADFRGYRNVIRRFLEVCGDKEIRLYTGADAGRFKEVMEKLPEYHGRKKNDKRTALELAEESTRLKLRTVSGKAVKNNFSRLSAIWRYYLLRDLVDRNLFTGWSFDTKKKLRRIRWSDEHLARLAEAPFEIATSISKETFGFIVGVGAYTGMRVEEICRLRNQDIMTLRGIPCIVIQEHEATEGEPWTEWNPKTEAGTRVVPVCQRLIDEGFLDFAMRSKQAGHAYLFHELSFSGKDKRRSGLFGRNFSTHKKRLGIPATMVFHSFRHYVSTKLRNIHEHGEGGLRDVWIDKFLGHEGQSRSVGIKEYLDEIEVENLKKVADAVVYPAFWRIKALQQ